MSQSDNATGAHAHSIKAQLAERVLDLLRGGRAGLVTDVDGTISPVVARPEEAIVLPAARRALTGLRDVLPVVAVVSGRSVADARKMVGVEGLTYIGNHGLEIWSDGAEFIVPEARPWVPRLAAVLDAVARYVEVGGSAVASALDGEDVTSNPTMSSEDPTMSSEAVSAEETRAPTYGTVPMRKDLTGVLIENKGVTATLHYRLAPDPDLARRALLGILARCAVTSGLRIEEGRRVINLLPPLTVTKGSAVTWLVRQHRLERLIYLGDDVTDAHAFKALAVMRQSDHIPALGIGVVGADTPPIVRQLADATLPSVADVADLLVGVLDGLTSNATMESRAPSVGST